LPTGTLRSVRQATISDAEAQVRLRASIWGLAERAPTISARKLLGTGQRRALIAIGLCVVAGAVLDPVVTAASLVAIATVVYFTSACYRFVLFMRSTRADVVITITDSEARAVSDSALPTYTVLIPVFMEPEVISHLLGHIAAIEYPQAKLDVKLLVEADDHDTLDAIVAGDPGRQFEVVLIPPSEPRTKPKALNYGFALARGDLVAVYDAEDIPDPLQLRRAAVAMSRSGPEVSCLQAKLSYHNVGQNLITRWFTLEYAMWFSFFLPGLSASRAPIPLGGTSNHFRRSALRSMGAWDPFNVTEDADLGIRMHREGFTVGILESTTYEEANSDFVNWARQRSRWYKGYLQTFIVHLRSPREVVREIGWRGVGHLCLFVGATPILALLNPFFWTLTVLWFIGHPAFIQRIFPAPVYYPALLCWVFGNFVLLYLTVISCRLIRHSELLWAAMSVPLYWVMMAVAGVKAMWQLVIDPNHWEKTMHGLDRLVVPAEDAA